MRRPIRASELVTALQDAIARGGDRPVLIIDNDTGWTVVFDRDAILERADAIYLGGETGEVDLLNRDEARERGFRQP